MCVVLTLRVESLAHVRCSSLMKMELFQDLKQWSLPLLKDNYHAPTQASSTKIVSLASCRRMDQWVCQPCQWVRRVRLHSLMPTTFQKKASQRAHESAECLASQAFPRKTWCLYHSVSSSACSRALMSYNRATKSCTLTNSTLRRKRQLLSQQIVSHTDSWLASRFRLSLDSSLI